MLANQQDKILEGSIDYEMCLSVGNKIMLFCGLATLMSLMASFAFDAYLPIQVQITAHIATILFSALFKLGYVIRCIGAHALGHEKF